MKDTSSRIVYGVKHNQSRKLLIGAGGWAYFDIPGISSLAAYSKVFNFVEINSTFYQIPPLNQVAKWRQLVPDDFEFSIRAHNIITHKYRFQTSHEVVDTLEKLEEISRILRSKILHFQTPSNIRIKDTVISNFIEFISSMNFGKAGIALEFRGDALQRTPEIIKKMQEFNIVHCVDLLKDDRPLIETDILYSRLFGKGLHNIYQPSDEELESIDKKISKENFRKVMLSFHGVRMYKDANRLKVYKQTGKFPMITESTGIESLEQILKEDTKFPTTKQDLIHKQGWKLFDLTPNKRIHTRTILQRLPKDQYGNINEIITDLQPLMD